MSSNNINTSALSQSVSSYIKKIEDKLRLPGVLSRAGYHSVFDIVLHPKKQFIQRNKELLRTQSEQVYDLALGLANQVRRAFRKNKLTAGVQNGLLQASSGQQALLTSPGGAALGLKNGGPSWQTQFSEDWSAYCQSNVPEANDSPVAYLSWIYNQALNFEQAAEAKNLDIITLNDRRPDLLKLMIDDNAINQVIPSLQLVNTILQEAITPSIASGMTVDKTLAETRYPSLLPYHFPHDQTELALDNANVALSSVISQTDTFWPYFITATLAGSKSEQAWGLGSQLAPEQQAIITEPTNVASTAFYQVNLGYDTADYKPFVNPDCLTRQTGTTVPELEQLLACSNGVTSVITSPNVANITADSSQYAAAFVNMGSAPAINLVLSSAASNSEQQSATDETSVHAAMSYALENLSDTHMDRINRMVRLQRWLTLPYEQVDLLLSACIHAQHADNDEFSPNTQTLRMLGVFRYYQQKYAMTAYQFAAVLDQMAPYAISPNVPFFDQVFNSPPLFETPLAVTTGHFAYPAESENDRRIVKQICAGLALSESQFKVLAEYVMAAQGNSSNELPCSLAVYSAFYRLTMLPRWLGLSFAEGAALFSLLGEGQRVWNTLAGVPVLAQRDSAGQSESSDILDILMALDSAVEWAKAHGMSWTKNYIQLQGSLAHPVPTTDTLNMITNINQQLLATLLTEATFDSSGVPLTDASGRNIDWMATLNTLVDSNGLVMPVPATAGNTVYDTLDAAVTTLVKTISFDASVLLTTENIANRLTTLIYQAFLTQGGIADSALAQLLGSPQSLSTFLLQWDNNSEYALLSDTLALKNITTQADIPTQYLQALYQLGRRASVATQFHLTPATLNTFLAEPTWFGVSDTQLTLTLLYRFSRYTDWLGLSGRENAVLAYLSWVNQPLTAPDTATAASALAGLLHWDNEEIEVACAQLNSSGLAFTVTDVDWLMRLQTLSADTGLSVTPLLSTGGLTLDSTYEDWQSVGESLVAAQSAQ